MKDGKMTWRWLSLGSLLAALASSQCGTTTSTSGTESHWLEACQGDASCGGLDCVCGVCTRPCEARSDCADLSNDALCTDVSGEEERCGSNAEVQVCTRGDTLPGTSSGGSGGTVGTSTSSGSGGGAGMPTACQEQVARGEGTGDCEVLVGVRWNGVYCEPLWGCQCAGADCDEIAPTHEACASAHADCFENDSCWDERRSISELLNENKDCITVDDCTSHFVGCGVSEDGCTGATYSNLELERALVNEHVGRLNTCVAAFEEDMDTCGLCERVSAPPQCIDGRCGSAEPCELEVSLLATFVGMNEACESVEDCVVETAGCGFSEDGCTGAVYMTRGFDAVEFEKLRTDLYACAGEVDSCILCERETTPAACISGYCRPAQ